MKQFGYFSVTLLISIYCWAGIGGSLGGTTSMTIDQLKADNRFMLKSPQVVFKAGYSTLFMQAVDTCIVESESGLVLKTQEVHSYLKETLNGNTRVENKGILSAPIDSNSILLEPMLVEVYRSLHQPIRDQKPLFIKEFVIPDCIK